MIVTCYMVALLSHKTAWACNVNGRTNYVVSDSPELLRLEEKREYEFKYFKDKFGRDILIFKKQSVDG